MRSATRSEAYVRQFVHGEMDGPVPFRYPGAPYVRDSYAGGALCIARW